MRKELMKFIHKPKMKSDIIIYHNLDTYASLFMNNVINYRQYMELVDAYIVKVSLYNEDNISLSNRSRIYEEIAMTIGEEYKVTDSPKFDMHLYVKENPNVKHRIKMNTTSLYGHMNVNVDDKIITDSVLTYTEPTMDTTEEINNIASNLSPKDTATIGETIQFLWHE